MRLTGAAAVHAARAGRGARATGFVEAVTGADQDVGTDLPRAHDALAPSRAAGLF